MTIAQGLMNELRDDATLAALVGARIWQEFAAQNATLPYIVFSRTSTESGLVMEGVDTLRNIRFQVDCYAQTIASLNSVRSRVGQLLDGKSGTLGAEAIQFCHIEGEQDLSDLVGDKAIRRISFQVNIKAHEVY